MTTNTTGAQARVILCSVIASTTFAMIAADLRGDRPMRHEAGGPMLSSQLKVVHDDVPVVQTWAEITNVPDPGANTGG